MERFSAPLTSTSLEASSTQPSQTISAVASITSVDIKGTPKRKALFQVGRGMQNRSLFSSLHCPSLTNMLEHEQVHATLMITLKVILYNYT